MIRWTLSSSATLEPLARRSVESLKEMPHDVAIADPLEPHSVRDAKVPVREGDMLAGKYRVETVLGVGGMGVVVAAQNVALGQRVAIKFMLPESMKDPAMAERFLRES